jgi:hypothetical protein
MTDPKGRRKRQIASELVRTEWLRRVEAEYRSAAITQQLSLWLIQIGASPDLIRAGLRITSDELTHADMSHRVYQVAGGTEMPKLARETLGVPPRGGPLEHDVTRVAAEVFCLGETVAVPLFKELRAVCSVLVARRALDRILRDEVRHRDFGWTLLGWLFESPGAADLRRVVVAELPTYFDCLRRSYAPLAAAPQMNIDPSNAGWGLIAPAKYGEVPVRRGMPPLFRSNMPPEGQAETTAGRMHRIGRVVDGVDLRI